MMNKEQKNERIELKDMELEEITGAGLWNKIKVASEKHYEFTHETWYGALTRLIIPII